MSTLWLFIGMQKYIVTEGFDLMFLHRLMVNNIEVVIVVNYDEYHIQPKNINPAWSEYTQVYNELDILPTEVIAAIV